MSTDYQFSNCYVQQLGNAFSYDYEYLGPSAHLVVTPLTERAFLAVGHALRTFHCGTMIGPNGTGKTETIRELSKVRSKLYIFLLYLITSISFKLKTVQKIQLISKIYKLACTYHYMQNTNFSALEI